MYKKLGSYLALVAAYFRLNLRSQLEYRGAFLSQAVAMFLNNIVWIIFWGLFFHRFPVLRGWTMNDFITLWGIVAAGFGLAHMVCGNVLILASLIAKGQLDAWMMYPRALLPHILLGRMSATACGDALFGYLVYLILVKPDVPHFLLFTALTVSVAMAFVGFGVFTGSLSFYLGNAEALSEQWRFAMVTFSTYPATLFEGAVKLLLYTLIPAAFVGYLPVEALRSFSPGDAACAVGGAFAVLAIGVLAFYHGLGRYESGNLMEMRG